MGLFNSNYSKPGPGVSKDEPKRKGLGRYYQLVVRKFWDLIKLNLLYIVTLLPTFAVVFVLSGMISNRFSIDINELAKLGGGSLVDAAKVSITTDLIIRFYISALFAILWGGGPATAGFVYILRSFIAEDPVFLASDYFKHIKSNLKQTIIVWIIDIIMFVLLCYAYFFYGSSPGILSNGKYVILVIALFYTMLHLYLYHLLVTYKLSIPQLYRNSALFAISALPFSIITIVFTSFIMLIWPAIGFTSLNESLAVFFVTATLILTVTLLFAVCGLYVEFNAVTQIKKYIKEDAKVERNE
ncbi:MAG: DUF624 domain-containing protein [Oscillospiraceae bacterium]|nr:DUF624 domain-containing protein [Oscillospiraceae bacterium]